MNSKGQMGFAMIAIITVIGLLFLIVGTQIVQTAYTTASTGPQNASYAGISNTIGNNLVPFMLLGGLALAGSLAFLAFRNR